MSAPAPVCKDCGAALVGPYCHSCGQRALQGRLRFADVGRWLVAKLLDADRGLLLTLREMTLRPGATIRRYVDGQRTRFTNPLAYLFIGGGLFALVWSFAPDAIRAKLAASFADDVRLFGPVSEAQARAAVELGAKTMFMAQLDLAVCLPLILILRLFFRRSGYTLAEISVFALFVFGHVSFLLALAQLPLLAVQTQALEAHGAVILLTYAVVLSQAGIGFFGGGRFKTAVTVLAALALAIAIYDLGERAAIRWYVLLTSR